MNKTAQVDLDTTRGRLEMLGLMHAAELFEQLVHQAVKENQAPYLFLDRLLQAEQNQREERRIATSLRRSCSRGLQE